MEKLLAFFKRAVCKDPKTKSNTHASISNDIYDRIKSDILRHPDTVGTFVSHYPISSASNQWDIQEDIITRLKMDGIKPHILLFGRKPGEPGRWFCLFDISQLDRLNTSDQ